MRSYANARILFGFLEFLAWAMVVVGLFAAIGGGGAASSYGPRGAGLIVAMPGLIICVFGLLLVAQVQNARAGVDSAEYGQQLLKVARDQLEISKQALKQGSASPQSFAAVKSHDGPATGASFEQQSQNDSTGAAATDGVTTGTAPSQPAEKSEFFFRKRRIRVKAGKYTYDNKLFENRSDVRDHISALEGNRATFSSDAQPVPLETNPPDSVLTTINYNGREITRENASYSYEGVSFDSREQAEAYIDQFAQRPLPGAFKLNVDG